MSEQRDGFSDQNGRSLAVLQNDVVHLTAEIRLLRDDFRAFGSDMLKWQGAAEALAQGREIRIDRLENRVKLVFWILGAAWLIILALTIAGLKQALGI